MACHATEQQVSEVKTTRQSVGEQLLSEPPILVYDIVSIPTAGSVSELSGLVEILTKKSGWEPLREGQKLQHESRLRIAAQAALLIKFSGAEFIRFKPAPKERWVELNDISSRGGT